MDQLPKAPASTTPPPGMAVRAFLIADLRGYTRYSEEHGDEAAAELTGRFAAMAREVVRDHSGSVVDLRGDEVLAVFDSPRDAVRAAVALQGALVSDAADHPETPLEAGMGLDAGEAAAVDGGFRARALNMAARLCARARPGEILITPELAHLAGPLEGIAVEDRGPVHLKGISRPIRMHAIITVGASGPRAASPLGTLEFRALGPLDLAQGGRAVPLGGRQQRLLLAHLLLQANRVVPADQLAELVWGDEPPRDPRAALQNLVSRLRTAFGGERIEAREPGYVLHAEADEVDFLRFERLLRRARRQLGIDPREAAATFEEALSLWRGSPLADLADAPSLAGEIARFEELRVAALEDLIGARLALGEHAEAIPELERLVAAHPLRERLWGHLMLALHRAGRRGEALAAFERVRSHLASTLGIDPSAELRELHERILADDSGLELRGQPLRSYRLIEQIGQGGLGTVWRALDPGVGREVAVKRIRSELAEDPLFVRRFAQEAQIVARIEHPHVVPLYDFWRDGSGAYLVMRLMRGGSLAETLAEDPLRSPAVTTITEQIASALAAAHRLGLVHRDVKPENILLDEDGNAYLSDFAIAETLPYGRSATTSEPDHRAPELTRGEAATAASDIYAFGVVVATMLQRTGQAIPPEAQAVVTRATAADPAQRFGDPRELAEGLRTALEVRPSKAAAATRAKTRNPYKGLRPFGEADADDFYGRDALIERLVARIGEDSTRLLAVLGPSGSGKSSVVRAGLLPALRRGALPGSERWYYADLLPGPHPLEELEAALLRVAVNPPSSLIEQLERDERGLARAVERVLPAEGGELLLLIDQFEEVFTLVEDEPLRQAFLEGLVAAVTDPRSRLRVVLTLRADFYDRPLAYPGLAEVFRAGAETVVPLSAEELERAIVGPAESVGATPERTLIAEVVGDVTDQPGALPLMQYALTETFERSPTGLLTLEAYRETGGVRGALAKRAEQLYTEMDDPGREAARQLFLRLVTIGEGVEDARRLVRRAELASLEVDPNAMGAVIEAFGRHRLLSFDRDPDTRGPTVEVAHEALLREWGRLRGWIDAAREDVIVHRRLAREAEEWERAGRDPSFLLRGSRLAQFEAWSETTGLALAAAERGYLQESLRVRHVEQAAEEERLAHERSLERRSIIRLRALAAVLTIAALVASALTVFAFNEQGRAARETSRAQEEASRAEREGRLATARELAAAATANLTVDPERSTLLALQALETTRQDATVLPEAVQTLHDAIAADRLLFTMQDPSTANVEWSPDGRLLASGGSAAGKDQTDVLLWDARTGEKLRTLSGHTTDIDELAFSPDSSKLVTNSHDGQMIVWDTRTGERLLTTPAGTGPGANFSPDGLRLVVGGSAPTQASAQIVDAKTGEILKTLVTADNVGLPVYSPDGKVIAVPLGENVSFYDAETGSEIRTFPVGSSYEIVYSPDGSRIVTQYGPGAAVFDALTGAVLFRLPGLPVGVDWSADGRLIATGDNDGTARIWDAATGEELLRLAGHRGGVALVSFSPDGTRLLTGGTDGTARVWDITQTATAEWLGAHEGPPRGSVSFSPDGRSLLTGGGCRGWLWETGTRSRIRPIPNACGPAAFGPQGATIARVTCMDDCDVGLIKILDAATGKELPGIDHVQGWPGSVAVSLDGKMIATAGARPAVWDASSGKAILDVDAGEFVNDVALSPDGTALAGIIELATLYLWEVPSGRELFHLQAQSGFGAAVAFATDGSKLATAGADGAAVWSRAGDRLASMTGAGRLSSVAFSGDGKRVASGGVDGTARIWDAATGEQLLVMKGHAGPVNDVAFSPDGTRLATVGEDGTLRVYVLPVDELVGIARARLSRSLSNEECRQYLHVETCPPPTSPTPSPPPQPATPPAGGPEGAYRVSVAAGDLPIPLSDAQEWYAGDYTLSLVDGTWRLDLDRTLLPRSDWFFSDEWSGPYTVSGDRIVLSVESGGDPGCLGSEVAGRWATADQSAISFAGLAWAATDSCATFQTEGDVPRTNDAWLRTIFESGRWIRIP